MTGRENLRILVIDDEITQRLLAKDFLEEAGHIVRQAEDGRRALTMASVTKPDVILLDVLLPGLDGYSLCKKFKEAPETCDAQVILVTASRESDVIEKGLAAGADDFVTKPVDWAFLADRVENVVKKARQRDEMARQIREQAAEEFGAQSQQSAAQFESQIDEVSRDAERRVAEALAKANESAAAELQRLETEYLDALNAAVAEAVAEKDSQIAEIRARHEEDMLALREQCEGEIDAICQTARCELAAAEERHAHELDAARAAPVQAQADIGAGDASLAELASRVDAAWGFALRWAAAHSSLTAALAVKSAARDASEDGFNELEQSARAIATAAAKMKILAEAMATPVERSSRPVDAAHLLAEIAEQAEAVARSRRVDVKLCLSDGQAVLYVDPNKLRYSILNLVSNALRFTPPGGAVELMLSSGEACDVRIDIVDSGVGVAPAKLQCLRSCLDGPSQHEDNAGFGIPAATALVRQMGGVLEFESQLGAGTRASLIFPEIVSRPPAHAPYANAAG